MKSEKELVEMPPSKMQAYFEDIAKEMSKYEHVMAQSHFTARSEFEARYSGLGGASHWRRQYQQDISGVWNGSSTGRMSAKAPAEPALDLAKAAPFIRAVIERMLDLLGDEESWIKGAAHRNEGGKDKWCLIGAQERALAELTLAEIQDDPVVERQRQRVLTAIKTFMIEALKEDKGFTSMPNFNDQEQTTFEDIRLWLKSLLGRLED